MPLPARAREMLDALLKSSTDAIYIKDCAGVYVLANAGCTVQTGVPSGEIVGKTDADLFPADAERIRAWDEKVLLRGEATSYERAAVAADGIARYYLTHKEPLRDATGAVIGLLGISRDITERKRMEDALEESARRYESLFTSFPYPLWLYDPETLRFVAVNDAAVEQYGYNREEFLTMSIADIRPADALTALHEVVAAPRDLTARYGPVVWRHRRKDGTVFEAEVTSTHFRADDADLRLVQALDVSEREQARRERRELARRLEGAFDGASIGMAILERDGAVVQVNPALCEETDYPADALIGRTFETLIHGEDREAAREHFEAVRTGAAERWQAVLRIVRLDGATRDAQLTLSLIRDAADAPRFVMAQVQDITERVAAEARLRWQAYHDTLTGLTNRSAFDEELTSVIARGRERPVGEVAAAILLMDLDRFKRINDSLGHAAGDRLIQAMADRLRRAAPPDAVISRMGGDEFTVLLRYEGGGAVAVVEQRARETARWLLETMSEPERIGEQEVFVSGSVGVSLFPNDGADAETLLKNADVSLYRAKEKGRGSFEFYLPAMNAGSPLRLRLETDLRRAVERREIAVFYQPQVEIISGRVIGVEALSRWNHPEWGPLLPDQFLPLVEEAGLSLTFDYAVLREACHQARRWHDAGFDCSVAVNLSPRLFAEETIVSDVAALLRATECPPHLLELEMTETSLVDNGQSVRERLWALKNLGIRLSVDDFGTGYSTLSYLRYFPLDVLKIDRSFVENLPDDTASRAVVRTLVDLARNLGLFIIAEGVERPEQRQSLIEMGCDAMQGFLVSPAIAAHELEQTLLHAPEGGPLA
jgi:diguanylate cyclase (GGDEF)-like protein/PAS domain S-box-containing protein